MRFVYSFKVIKHSSHLFESNKVLLQLDMYNKKAFKCYVQRLLILKIETIYFLLNT